MGGLKRGIQTPPLPILHYMIHLWASKVSVKKWLEIHLFLRESTFQTMSAPPIGKFHLSTEGAALYLTTCKHSTPYFTIHTSFCPMVSLPGSVSPNSREATSDSRVGKVACRRVSRASKLLGTRPITRGRSCSAAFATCYCKGAWAFRASRRNQRLCGLPLYRWSTSAPLEMC